MKLRLITCFIALTSWSSCSSDNSAIEEYRLVRETYNIPTSGKISLSNPHHLSNDTLYSFDSYQKTLLKLSLLDSQIVESQIEFDFELEPYIFYYIQRDSVLFSTGNKLFLSDQNGKIYHQIGLFSGLNQIEKEVYQEYPFDGFAPHLFYNGNSKSVLLYFAKRSQIDRRKVWAEISISNGTWKVFDGYHPEEYDGDALNYTTFPSVTWGPGGLYFQYSIAPIVTQLDTVSSRQKDFIIRSFDGIQFAEPQTYREEWTSDYFENWVLTSPNYLKLIYDPFRNLFYRFSHPALDSYPPSGKDYYEYLVENRDIHLTVLNERMEVLLNEILPKGKYDVAKSMVFSKGLLVPIESSSLKDEEQLYVDLFKVAQKSSLEIR
ncbi:hypothetical protein [Algoriphagus sediminis]|uniref:DUF4221 domain-containing protein n=1 Tax=Algoriphagus sediminis TaxID=3057113 RepID=A0ABT7YHG5_9BACT|nr:hypothetical protein [Algoriphagus sediminis]MDN3205974.1 hypothetical protein [Algoriphagus sediminis]